MDQAESTAQSVYSVLAYVAKERRRQDLKGGVQNHSPDRWLVILGEEFGEACRAAYEGLQRNGEDYLEELTHVAAVAVAAIESFQRNNPKSNYDAN